MKATISASQNICYIMRSGIGIRPTVFPVAPNTNNNWGRRSADQTGSRMLIAHPDILYNNPGYIPRDKSSNRAFDLIPGGSVFY